jgi:hypothetical protein
MAYVGLTFSPREAGALAGLYALPELGAPMRRPGARVGMGRAEVRGALTDGGAGPEEFPRASFPRAERVPDFYHAAEHLDARAKEAAGAWRHTLKHEGGEALRAAREALDRRGRKGEAREAHRREAGYVRNNVHRMDYPRSAAAGWLIGSGPGEAACKAAAGQRKRAPAPLSQRPAAGNMGVGLPDAAPSPGPGRSPLSRRRHPCR